MIMETQVIVSYIRNMYCDECKEPMKCLGYNTYHEIKNGMSLGQNTVDEGYYKYVCHKCGREQYSKISYPQQIHTISEPVEVEEINIEC